jgi:hypothetical protein
MSASSKINHDEDFLTSLTKLDGRVSSIEAVVTNLAGEFKGLAQAVNASQRTNWPMLIGLATLALGMVGGAWVIIDLKSQNALTPVMIQNAISTQERQDNRDDLNKVIEIVTSEVSSRRSGFAALQQQVAEAEGQHRSNDNVRNGNFQHLEGQISWLYEFLKLPKPSPITFMPTIGRVIDIPIPND